MCKYRDCDFIFPSMLLRASTMLISDVVVMGDDEIIDAEFVPAHRISFAGI